MADAPAFWQRLSALDAFFLDIEEPHTPSQVGAVILVENRDLLREDGSFDWREWEAIAARRGLPPRYGQQLAYVPGEGHPVWVDCPRFDPEEHRVRVSPEEPLAPPDLCRMVEQWTMEPLPRDGPLWRQWIVDRVEGDTYAAVFVQHHCMLDGTSGVGLLAGELSPDPDAVVQERAEVRVARPLPSAGALLRESLRLRWEGLVHAARALAHPLDAARGLAATYRRVRRLLRETSDSDSDTPLRRPPGRRRRYLTHTTPLAEVKFVKQALGGTVNDVMLAAVGGGLRHYLARRGFAVDDLTKIRAGVAVDVRTAGESEIDNRISALRADLAVAEPDPVRRLRTVQRSTTEAKAEQDWKTFQRLTRFAERTWPGLLVWLVRRSARKPRIYTVGMSNLRGPGLPLYTNGRKVRAIFPLTTLGWNESCNIGSVSYDGTIYWGFTACADALPDLERLVEDIDVAFAELREAALKASPASDGSGP
jgi:diacylglycerol O-acyltransferase